jgi:hypothetical protein
MKDPVNNVVQQSIQNNTGAPPPPPSAPPPAPPPPPPPPLQLELPLQGTSECGLAFSLDLKTPSTNDWFKFCKELWELSENK